ncbi:MAG TPA: hypothetical protein VIB99_11795, partial [Candidatus Limnocylindrales bacterium]
MQRPAQPRPPQPDREIPGVAIAVGGLVVVLVVVALLVLSGRLQPSGSPSAAPSAAEAQPTPSDSGGPGSSGGPDDSVGPGSSNLGATSSAGPAPDRPIAYSRTAGTTAIWSMQPGGAAIQLGQDGPSTGAAWSHDARQI